jgi:hypothetical protein
MKGRGHLWQGEKLMSEIALIDVGVRDDGGWKLKIRIDDETYNDLVHLSEKRGRSIEGLIRADKSKSTCTRHRTEKIMNGADI